MSSLKQYLDGGGVSANAFADRLCAPVEDIIAILEGREPPSLALARRIVESAEGVTLEDLYRGAVTALPSREQAPIDQRRLATAVIATNLFRGEEKRIADAAAEAVEHTFIALGNASAPTRRLLLALTSVLEQIPAAYWREAPTSEHLGIAAQLVLDRYQTRA